MKTGNDVIADSCNPIKLTRSEWEKVASSSGADFENIEIICSDRNLNAASASFAEDTRQQACSRIAYCKRLVTQ